jgi:Fe-S cluster assembly protein SufD
MSNTKANFLRQFDDITAVFPIQGDARAAIHNGLDFPTTRDEKWKYTRVSSILAKTFKRNEIAPLAQFSLVENEYQLVFINGSYRPDLSSSLPASCAMESMAEIKGETRDYMLTKLGQLANFKDQAFLGLNTSYFQDGAFLKVEKNAVIDQPINIINISQGQDQVSNVRNLICIEPNAQVQFVHRFEGDSNREAFTNSVMEICVDEHAHVDYYLIENEGTETTSINATYVSQARHSTFSMVTITKSGQLVRNNLHVAINDVGCETNMSGIYFTDGSQHVDNQTYADHRQPNCNSNELYKGVMADRSTGVFNGKIMVHQAAQQTNAFQSNQNILLGDRATINTKPELEIYADDVKCSHGCTIGQLDEEAMFYLQSRGLGKEAAHKLLVQAFASDVIEKIKIASVRKEVETFIESKFE